MIDGRNVGAGPSPSGGVRLQVRVLPSFLLSVGICSHFFVSRQTKFTNVCYYTCCNEINFPFSASIHLNFIIRFDYKFVGIVGVYKAFSVPIQVHTPSVGDKIYQINIGNSPATFPLRPA